jgi:hypothetical protein
MIKAGRYTAALLLVTVGALLLIDHSLHTNTLSYLLEWWPVLLISLGMEYILLAAINSSKERQLRLDVGGILFSLIVCAIVIGMTQASVLSGTWFRNAGISLPGFNFSGDSGPKFAKGVTNIPLNASTDKVEIRDVNGEIVIRSGNVEQIQVDTTVYVEGLDGDEAKRVADDSKIVFSGDGTLQIEAAGEEYKVGFFGKRKPRMDLVVTMPAKQKVDLDVQVTNGKVDASQLPVKDLLNIRTVNGAVTANSVEGNVKLSSTNGKISAAQIKGSAELHSVNGAISAENVSGDVKEETTNGSVNAKQIDGRLETRATNGKTSLEETRNAVHASTINGDVTIASHTIGGDWDVKTTHGSVTLNVPANGDFEVKGSSRGAIRTNLPLTIDNHTVEGKIGPGKYRIQIHTNSGISINATD